MAFLAHKSFVMRAPRPKRPTFIGATFIGATFMTAAVVLASCAAAPLSAQGFDNAISQPVIQPLPSAEQTRLKTALRLLANNSNDVAALIEAGDASLAVDDADAAIGFFGRARQISPDNLKVKTGLAAALVRKQRPLEALTLFDEAQALGASTSMQAGDRALAYDLIGDNANAMGLYRQALSQQENAAIRRQFALSHAIAGDRSAFEAVLAPLISAQDPASYRTRAFGLAILGEEDEAVAIAEAVMPQNLSARIAPYLRYMPRLTKAQQAAAANFGDFPRAAQIGRDTPDIARYIASSSGARNADARLTPQGEPLGSRADATSTRRRPGRATSAVETAPQTASQTAAPTPSRPQVAAAVKQPSRAAASPILTRDQETRRARNEQTPQPDAQPNTQPAPEPAPTPILAAKPPAAPPVVSGQPAPTQPVLTQQVAAVVEEKASVVAIASPIPVTAAPTPDIVEAVAPALAPAPAPVPAQASASTLPTSPPTAPAPAQVAVVSASNFDLANVAPGPVEANIPDPDPEAASVAEAFANFGAPPVASAAVVGGIDITTIEPPREVAKKPPLKADPKAEPKAQPKAEVKPAAPAHPRRFWVQIATGKDRAALKFDWRRFSRKAPDVLGDLSGHVTTWGQSNRLLAGPFKSAKDANNALTELKKSDVDGFTYTSPVGQEIDPL